MNADDKPAIDTSLLSLDPGAKRARAQLEAGAYTTDAIRTVLAYIADAEESRDRWERNCEDAIHRAEHWANECGKARNLALDNAAMRDHFKGEVDEARKLIDDAWPAVRLVNDWATWSDSNLYAYVDAILRKCGWTDDPRVVGKERRLVFTAIEEVRRVARGRLGDDGFTIPPTYDEEGRERAKQALSVVDLRKLEGWPKDVQGAIVDAVATALGMWRARA